LVLHLFPFNLSPKNLTFIFFWGFFPFYFIKILFMFQMSHYISFSFSFSSFSLCVSFFSISITKANILGTS
jgi:hypothetical protein